MRSVMRNARLLGGPVALALAFSAAPAAAQPEATVYATGSIDGVDTGVRLVGVTVRGGGLGLQPVGALQAYYLQYTIPDTDAPGDQSQDVSLVGLQPQIGAAWYGYGGAIEARVGYSIISFSGDDNDTDPDEDPDVLEGGVGGEGITTTLQAQTWATRPELFGLASFNWGADYLYTQGQAVLPLGRIGVGAEAVWQQHLGGDGDFEYRSTQFGPVVRFGLGPESSLTLAGGYKDDNVRDPTWYARLTVVRWGIGF